MKRNCNLELRLVTPSPVQYTDIEMKRNRNLELRLVTASSVRYPYMMDIMGSESPNKKQQQLTIFYNGRVAVCDATELQARAIISLASRDVDDKWVNPIGPDPKSPLLTSPLYSPPSGLSMKRSLTRFLEKRKTRAQATSPYPNINTNDN